MFVIKDTTSRALTLARVEERRTTGATLAPHGTTAALLVIIVLIVITLIIIKAADQKISDDRHLFTFVANVIGPTFIFC